MKNFSFEKLNITFCDCVTSTNDILKEEALKGAPEGTVLIASMQTRGKGRLSRSFFSPDKSGLYMSIILRPKILPEKSVLITTAAAVAVSKAIEHLTDKKAGIKWVNDIFINGKKVAGILTEAAFSGDGKALQYAVLGIGINLFEPENGFPEDLKDIASAVFEKEDPEIRETLIFEILNNFFSYYEKLSAAPHIEEYRNRSIVIGKKINVLSGEAVSPATAIGIDDDCRLQVIYENGEEGIVSSGEISIRII